MTRYQSGLTPEGRALGGDLLRAVSEVDLYVLIASRLHALGWTEGDLDIRFKGVAEPVQINVRNALRDLERGFRKPIRWMNWERFFKAGHHE